MIVEHGCGGAIARGMGPIAALLALLSLLPNQVRADGFELFMRSGYAPAMGKVVGGGSDGSDNLNRFVAAQVPFWLDVGYRFADRIFVGAYVQLGLGINGQSLKDSCSGVPRAHCSTEDFRLGMQSHVHLLPEETLDPWIGYGFGYERMSSSITQGSAESSMTFQGYELANFQAGLDVLIAGSIRVGPFISFSLGQYSRAVIDCLGSGCSSSYPTTLKVTDKALHEWLLIGVRGGFAHKNRE